MRNDINMQELYIIGQAHTYEHVHFQGRRDADNKCAIVGNAFSPIGLVQSPLERTCWHTNYNSNSYVCLPIQIVPSLTHETQTMLIAPLVHRNNLRRQCLVYEHWCDFAGSNFYLWLRLHLYDFLNDYSIISVKWGFCQNRLKSIEWGIKKLIKLEINSDLRMI